MKFRQQPHSVLMIRPAAFGFNPLTAQSNVFQQSADERDGVLKRAQDEFDRMVDLLTSHEIDVRVFKDEPSPPKPDAVFPNNWISFHEDGTIVLYPMMAANRRCERRLDITNLFQNEFIISNTVALYLEEKQNKFLEGSGSIVFDHANRIAYACRSPRTHADLFIQLTKFLKYRPVLFDATDENGTAIYHTNVIMCVGEKFAVVCLDAIKSDVDQELLLSTLESTSHRVIAISYAQMRSFAGNMIEVLTQSGDPIVLLSQSAFESLLPGQIKAIGQFSEILPVPIPIIEKTGGGSVRCMVAGIHLPRRNAK